jgi:aminomuconate-semialdehyde/2-hydroxymuconate-6-semialdehyde dehydrogenase
MIKNYINGALIEASDHAYLDVYNPALGEVYTQAPDSSISDVELAVAAAKEAFPIWSKISNEDRSSILMKIADGIDKRFDELALAESIDNGKPLSLAKSMDIPRSSANMRFFAHAASQFASEAHEMVAQNAINYTLRNPLGIVACISPWNLPLYLFTWKIAPALATGNCVIAKPSEITPMTAYIFSQICIEAGLPPGVLNIVHGLGHKVGDALSHHREIKAISFTGSTKVGKEIASIAAPMFKKISLEMGGKNAVVIFDDCNYEKMLATVVRSSFSNQGQICLCGSRIYIQDKIYEKFKTDFINETKKLKVGNPLDTDTKIGAIVSKAHYEKILNHIDIAKEEGGIILAGGQSINPVNFENGWYVEPTIIEGLTIDCRTNQEEIFGPVVTIAPFHNDTEAIALNNGTHYGLTCSIWTENLSRAHRLAKEFDTGIVWINTWLMRDLRTPFGGTKNSGVGREGGFEAMRFFTESRNVCIQY